MALVLVQYYQPVVIVDLKRIVMMNLEVVVLVKQDLKEVVAVLDHRPLDQAFVAKEKGTFVLHFIYVRENFLTYRSAPPSLK